jgi:hypothetical protein
VNDEAGNETSHEHREVADAHVRAVPASRLRDGIVHDTAEDNQLEEEEHKRFAKNDHSDSAALELRIFQLCN